MGALWLGSVRRRPGAALAVFVIVTIASASAVAGPMLVRAAEQSGLRSLLDASAPGRYDIEISASTDDDVVSDVAYQATRAAAVASRTLFDRPVTFLRSQQPHTWRIGAHRDLTGYGVSPAASCVPGDLTAGACPSLLDEVLLPAALRVAPGTSVTIPGRDRRYRVSGSYRPSALPSWYSELGHQPVLMGDQTLELIDPAPTVLVRDHLRVAALDLDTLSAAEDALHAVTAAVLRQTVVSAPQSDLPLLADAVHADRTVATVVGLLTVVPLVLLCWYTLVLVMQLIAVVRSREWALGRLRGLPLPAWLRSLYWEPGVLLVAGVVAGFAAGLGVAALTARLTMAPGTPLEPWRLPVLACFAGTVVGAALGIAIATVRGARVPLATLLQQAAEPSRLTRVGVAVQVLVGAAAVLSLVQLATRRQVTVGAGDLGVLLPGLLAAALSLLLIRASARVVRRSSARPARTVRRLVIGRRLGRNPALLSRYLVVAVATAVLVFTVALAAIMRHNVGLRADNEVGAAEVVTVDRVAPEVLLDDVRTADPSGRQAMAVEQLQGPTVGGTSRIVAVDTSRLAEVSYWQPSWAGLDAEQARRALDPPAHLAPVTVRGSTLTMSLADTRSTTASFNADPTASAPRPKVEVTLFDRDHWDTVVLGRLTAATATLSAPIACAHGCVLRRIGFHNDTGTPFSAATTITSMRTDQQSAQHFATYLRSTAAWQPNLVGAEPGYPVRAAARGTRRGLAVRLRDFTGESTPALIPTDGPPDVPAIAATNTNAEPLPAFRGAVDGTALDASQLPITVVARAQALPSSVADGVLVDLAVISRFTDPADSQATAQVWLAPGAPATMLTALRHAGLHVQRVTTTRTPTDRLLAAAPVRAAVASAAAVLLLAALAAAALGAGAAIDGERRRSSVRVLRASGFSHATVRRLCFEEVALPGCAAALVGVLAGTAAVLIAGARLPLFADPAGPPLATTPPWSAIGVAALAVLVIVALASAAFAGAALARVDR